MNLRKALAWSMYGQVISYIISFSSSVVVARLLTPRDMGIFAIAIATIGVLNVIVAFDIGTYVIRAQELLPSTIDSAFTMNGLLSCVISAVIYSLGLIEGLYFENPDVARVLAFLAVTPLIGAFEFRPSMMLRREMNFQVLALIGIGKVLISTPLIILLAMNGFSYMSLVYGTIVSGFFGAVCINIVARRHASLRVSLSEGRSMAVFGLRMISIGGVATIAARLSDIILGQMLGLAALGMYSRASSIANLLFENVYGAMTRVIFVQLSDDFRTKGTVRDIFLRSFEMITALMWPIQIGLATLSGPVIYNLYGERWTEAALPLSLLMIAQCVVLCFGMNWELFVIRDETARQVRFEGIRAAVSVLTFTIGCLFNTSAAAVGRIAEAVFGFFLYQPHMNKMADTQPGELGRVFVKSAGLTIAAVVPSLILMIATRWSYRTPLLHIAGAVLIGVLFWLALLARQRHPLMIEIQAAVRKLRARLHRKENQTT